MTNNEQYLIEIIRRLKERCVQLEEQIETLRKTIIEVEEECRKKDTDREKEVDEELKRVFGDEYKYFERR